MARPHTISFPRIFFFTATATTEIYTLSLHDALPISPPRAGATRPAAPRRSPAGERHGRRGDRKSTRLNSSHTVISYAVFCLKKKTHIIYTIRRADIRTIPLHISQNTQHRPRVSDSNR